MEHVLNLVNFFKFFDVREFILISTFLAITLFIFFSWHSAIEVAWAQDTETSLSANLSSNPQLLFHPIDGCPANSKCTADLGKVRKMWIEELKKFQANKNSLAGLKKFQQNYGIPFNLWFRPGIPKGQAYALWDSPCDLHRNKRSPRYIGYIFLSQVTQDSVSHILKKYQNTIEFHHVYLFKGNNAPVPFTIPRDEYPIEIQGQKLVFLAEDEGVIYQYQISVEGKIEMMAPTARAGAFETIPCPPELLAKLDASLYQNEVYSGHLCRSYHNEKTQERTTLLFPFACH